MKAMTSMPPEDWPQDALERVVTCPVCCNPRRSAWRADLTDRIFATVGGRWTLWRCAGCAAAYLDPRPTVATIGRAYSTYYTHASEPGHHIVVPSDLPAQRRRRAVHASYYNRYFGHRLVSALPLGWTLIASSRRRRARADQSIRHLPAPSHPEAVLLDLGCGDGAFLRVARALGYVARGLEFDPAAAATARRAGFEVETRGVDQVDYEPNSLDQVTLNHVIEHVHDPVGLLRRVLYWLRPGGRVWLQTPNIDGNGSETFAADWRGLEPPRHLVLFTPASLGRALADAGFTDVALQLPPPDASFYVAQSQALRDGRDPYQEADALRRRAAKRIGERWNRASLGDPRRAESITMVGFRPQAVVR